MKKQIKRNQVKVLFDTVYQCGYCALEPLYHESEARFYASGVYGWNFDVYTFGAIAITSGYRSMVGAELPEKCKQILKNAARYYAEFMSIPFRPNYAPIRIRRENYFKLARRRFEKALQEATK